MDIKKKKVVNINITKADYNLLWAKMRHYIQAPELLQIEKSGHILNININEKDKGELTIILCRGENAKFFRNKHKHRIKAEEPGGK